MHSTANAKLFSLIESAIMPAASKPQEATFTSIVLAEERYSDDYASLDRHCKEAIKAVGKGKTYQFNAGHGHHQVAAALASNGKKMGLTGMPLMKVETQADGTHVISPHKGSTQGYQTHGFD